MQTGLKRALEIIGGKAALAKHLGITKQAVGQWEQVPPDRVLAVEDATGVPCYEMRPDIYRVPAA